MAVKLPPLWRSYAEETPEGHLYLVRLHKCPHTGVCIKVRSLLSPLTQPETTRS